MTIRAAVDRYEALVEEIGNRVDASIGIDEYVQVESSARHVGRFRTTTRNGTRIPNENFRTALEEGRQRHATRDVMRIAMEFGNDREVRESFSVMRWGSNSLVTAVAHGIPLALVGATAFFTAYVMMNNR